MTKAISMDISYQIDIWANTRVECDQIYEELLFYMQLEPNLSIEIPTQGQQDFALALTDVDMATEVTSFAEQGRLYRYTLTYELQDANIFLQERRKVPVDIDVRVEG